MKCVLHGQCGSGVWGAGAGPGATLLTIDSEEGRQVLQGLRVGLCLLPPLSSDQGKIKTSQMDLERLRSLDGNVCLSHPSLWEGMTLEITFQVPICAFLEVQSEHSALVLWWPVIAISSIAVQGQPRHFSGVELVQEGVRRGRREGHRQLGQLLGLANL